MSEPELNPYNFASLEEEKVHREPFPGIDRVRAEHVSGVLICELEALGPLFTADHQNAKTVPGHEPSRAFSFLRNANRDPILQGTSIRGMIRAVYEAAFPSCLPLVAARGASRQKGRPVEYELTLPDELSRCSDRASLCPACRLFGVIGDEVHAQGRVTFEDAVLCGQGLQPGRIHLRELSSPKPHHYYIYSQTGARGGAIRGRKLFYHHDPGARPPLKPTSREWSERSNAIEEVATRGARFSFKVHFLNLSQDELRQLVGCLVLDNAHAHKIGMAKPLGYGSCRIHIKAEESRCWKGGERYRSWSRTGIPVVPQTWTPAPDALERLLRFPGTRKGVTGYRSLDGYAGTGIDEEGRYVPAPGARASTPSKPTGPQTLGNPLERLFAAPVESKRKPEAKKFRKGDSAKVKVLKVEEPGRRYLLQCRESAQDDIVIETSYVWREGEMKTVKVVKVDGEGRIKEVRFL